MIGYNFCTPFHRIRLFINTGGPKQVFEASEPLGVILFDKQVLFSAAEAEDLTDQFIFIEGGLYPVDNLLSPADIAQLEGCHQLELLPPVIAWLLFFDRILFKYIGVFIHGFPPQYNAISSIFIAASMPIMPT